MSIETKKIYLDENFEIIDGNREYFIYFERVGHRFSKIDELVPLEEKDRFINFLHNSSVNQYDVFHFQKYTGEYRYNRVRIYDEVQNGKKVKCVILIDLEDAFEFFDKAILEDRKMCLALSIVKDSFFVYDNDTKNFRLLHYSATKPIVDFNMNIDAFKNQMIEGKLILSEQIPEFETFIDGIKSCFPKVFLTLKCSFRTHGKIVETLNFYGERFEDRDGKITVVGRIIPDAKGSETQQTNQLLDELQLDALTKCYNKKTIISIFQKRFKECRPNDNFALVIVDLDNFKPVNDAYGHLAGDKVLAETGEILRVIVGNGGFVGRYGGDEFLLLLNDMGDEVVLRGTLQTILVNIRSHFASSFEEINITCSIGASVFNKNGTDYNDLFRKSDFCLYRAKDKGRNRYVFFREDLHGELFAKSIESTTGVKYAGRDVQELKIMAAFMQELSVTPYKAIREILAHMLKFYNLGDVTIYYGEDMKRIYYAGEKQECQKDALYVNEPYFAEILGDRRFIRMDFPEDVRSDEFKTEMEKRGIKTTLQCILGSPDEIKGLVTFDRLKESSQWAEYEVNCAVMFASSFNLLPEATKVDFALHSKLKDL